MFSVQHRLIRKTVQLRHPRHPCGMSARPLPSKSHFHLILQYSIWCEHWRLVSIVCGTKERARTQRKHCSSQSRVQSGNETFSIQKIRKKSLFYLSIRAWALKPTSHRFCGKSTLVWCSMWWKHFHHASWIQYLSIKMSAGYCFLLPPFHSISMSSVMTQKIVECHFACRIKIYNVWQKSRRLPGS